MLAGSLLAILPEQKCASLLSWLLQRTVRREVARNE